MKKLADISSFESLGNSNAAFVNNTSTRRSIRNSIFSKGASGDVDRALMAKRGVALLKEGAGILAQLGVNGATIALLASGSMMRGATRIPKAIRDTILGRPEIVRGPQSQIDALAELGEGVDNISMLPYLLKKYAGEALPAWSEKDKRDIARLRAIKAKGKKYQ